MTTDFQSHNTEKDFLPLYAEETKRLMWHKAGLDATRNIAVLVLFGMIFIAFGFSEPTSHRVAYFGSLAVFALLLFEARLFRLQANCAYRVQLLEQNFLPRLFDGQALEKSSEEQLAGTYTHPLKPSFREAIAHRIYKNYFLIFLAVDISWLSKVYLSPQPAESFSGFVHRLDLGFFPGWITVGFMTLFWTLFIASVIWIQKKKKQKPYLHGW